MSHGPETEPLPPGVPATTEAPRAPRLLRPPFWIISILTIVVIASWLPLVFFARARTSRTSEPRVHLVQDMGSQSKYREQMASGLFADGRADRPRVAGTVSRGGSELDDHYYRGYERVVGAGGGREIRFFTSFPKQVRDGERLRPGLVERGRERFNIYCAPCHGYDGYGEGTVVQRSRELNSAINASNLHEAQFRDRADGHIFNTITNGIRSMPPYGGQIPVEDRWAIVAYVRALQLSQNAPPTLAANPAEPK